MARRRASPMSPWSVSTPRGPRARGHDRPSMALPGDQDALIQAVAAANKKTIVVLNNGTPVLMTGWLGQVPGLIETWFPGQEGGHALAAILFGDVNPSGKLPTTLGARREDYPDFGHFPGIKGQVDYAEGIYVGYRHFDKEEIAPAVPLRLRPVLHDLPLRPSASLPADARRRTARSRRLSMITNTGSRTGAEVVELYRPRPPAQDRQARARAEGLRESRPAAGRDQDRHADARPARPGLLRCARQAVEGGCGRLRRGSRRVLPRHPPDARRCT